MADEAAATSAPMKNDSVKDSKGRSESFRDAAAQTAKIEALDKDNKKLAKELSDKTAALEAAEEKVEGLQEQVAQTEELRKKADQISELNDELASLKRENANLQASSKRRSSTLKEVKEDSASSEQLKAKTAAVEALELEVSKLKHASTEAEGKTKELETKLKTSEDAGDASRKQLEELRTMLDSRATTGEKGVDASEDADSRARDAEARLSLLTSDVELHKKAAADAQGRVTTLEKKIATLEKLHKSTSANGGRPPMRKSVDGDSGGVEELEDEERRQLQARVRELESEVFELRRGVWRDTRAGLQGEMEDDATSTARSPGAFSDVDLSQGPYGGHGKSRRQSGGGVAQAFGFQNVISAFTGQQGGPAQHRRGLSKGDGLLDEEDDDMEFDEEAFRKAQEEEAQARIERVREVKRGLSGWKGWKVDLVELRGGEQAGVFDV